VGELVSVWGGAGWGCGGGVAMVVFLGGFGGGCLWVWGCCVVVVGLEGWVGRGVL